MSRLGFVVAFAGILTATAIPAQQPKFEVASIKPCQGGGYRTFTFGGPAARGRGGRGRGIADPGRLRIECRTVPMLIVRAYLTYADGRSRSEVPMIGRPLVEGGPAWVETDRYTIDAKPESPQTMAMMHGPMMQALLEERFKLTFHRETREVPSYALVVAKGGPRLPLTKKDSCTPVDLTDGPPPAFEPGKVPPCGSAIGGADGLEGHGFHMVDLCRTLGALLQRQIIDRTGITSMFDLHGFRIAAAPGDSDSNSADPADTVRESLQALGLRLEAAKGTAEFIVIDHLERPTEN